ncbi:hypothetical protein HY772_04455 [Candidatus Woesearchaeota archaeon]|nr:hypothetical protein [Candidatus Woesearchaeota archaeon]
MVILFDQFHLPNDVFDIVFATDQQAIAARMLLHEIKRSGGSLGKTEMSMFVKTLHAGTTIEVRDKKDASKSKHIAISYNRRQFYDRVLTPLKSMGLIDYDLYKKKYTPSDRFNASLIAIGALWLEELKRMER